MKNYFDIKVLPDAESSAQQLMNVLFTKLHPHLAKCGQGRLAVSFPNAGLAMGNLLRIHGMPIDLENLAQSGWLKGMTDYTLVGEISDVPATHELRLIRRIQRKSVRNLRRRLVLKGKGDELTVENLIPDQDSKRTLDLPFLQIRSLSNRNMLRIYVDQTSSAKSEVPGTFSSYGFSSHATVPWF